MSTLHTESIISKFRFILEQVTNEMFLTKFYWMPWNARITAFTVSDLLRENQQVRERGEGGGVKSHPLPRLESIHKELRVRSNTFFYCEMTIYIPFMLFKSNHVWFEKYKLENKQSIQYLIIYRRFVNLGFNKAIYLLFYQNWFLLCKPLIYISV